LVSEASAPQLVTGVDGLIAFAGGGFNQLRTNDPVSNAFTSSPTTAPYIESQNGRGVYNVWQATAANNTGIYNLQTADIITPTAANAVNIVNHLGPVYEQLLNEDSVVPVPQGWNGFCRTGLFPVMNPQGQVQNINVFFCAGQQRNHVATLAVLSSRAFDSNQGGAYFAALVMHYRTRMDRANQVAPP
jgi:hypothetical protein